jgi:hypothetical protein
MAWSASKVFAFTVLDVGENNVKFSTDAYNVALYSSNTMTPDNTVTTQALCSYNGTASQWVTANESSATGYTAGGTSVSSPTWTQSSNVVTFTSAGTPSWTVTSGTLTAYGCLVYDTTVGTSTTHPGLSYNYFGGAQTVSGSGTFTINWNASGIATFTC